jgi:DNA-binding response OmpR family regulator
MPKPELYVVQNGTFPNRQKPRLMIVDDEPGLTHSIAKIASAEGFNVHIVTDSKFAVDEFSRFCPNVLILDLVMPEPDGLDVLSDILLLDPEVRVIVMSG